MQQGARVLPRPEAMRQALLQGMQRDAEVREGAYAVTDDVIRLLGPGSGAGGPGPRQGRQDP